MSSTTSSSSSSSSSSSLLSNAEQSLEKMMAEAVYWLQRAVKLDNQLPRGDMASVSNHYSSGLAILSSIVDHLPDSVRPDIEQKIEAYNSRLQYLREYALSYKTELGKQGIFLGSGRQTPRSNSGLKSTLPPITFVEDTTLATKFMSLPPPPPNTNELRIFWMMGILILTIDKGAFLTTKVWIPKNLWTQADVPIVSQLDKVACLMYVENIALTRLSGLNMRDISTSTNEMNAALQEFHGIQNHLAFISDTVPEHKQTLDATKDKKILAQKKNSVIEKIKALKLEVKDADCVDTTEYSKVISTTLKSLLSLEKQLKQCKPSDMPQVWEAMKQICNFYNVIVTMILSDLAILIREFMRKSQQSFFDIPPLVPVD